MVCGNCVALDYGDATCDLFATTQSASVDDIDDSNWDTSTRGDDVLIEIDASIDDNNVAVDFICCIAIVGVLYNSFGTPLDSDSDHLQTPNWPTPVNSANFPNGRFENDTLSISFQDVGVNCYIEVHVTADIENHDNNPATHSQDEDEFTVTVI
jgi:hypothetical protein